MPLYQELIRKHALIVQAFHESIEIFLLRLVSLHKVQYDRLEQTLDTNLAISLDQPQECSLILSPSLYDIALLWKYAAEENIVLVFGGYVHNELGLSHFRQQIIHRSVASVDVGINLTNYTVYKSYS